MKGCNTKDTKRRGKNILAQRHEERKEELCHPFRVLIPVMIFVHGFTPMATFCRSAGAEVRNGEAIKRNEVAFNAVPSHSTIVPQLLRYCSSIN